jgi:hypothetical protein
VAGSAQTRSSPARRPGCLAQGSDHHRASSSIPGRQGTWLPSSPHGSWRTARGSPKGYGLPGCLHCVALSQTDVHQHQIRATPGSKIDCLLRDHGEPHHDVTRRFKAAGVPKATRVSSSTIRIRMTYAARFGWMVTISRNDAKTTGTIKPFNSSKALDLFYDAQTDRPFMPLIVLIS